MSIFIEGRQLIGLHMVTYFNSPTRKLSVNKQPKSRKIIPMPTEKVLHQQVCDYLKLQYPNVIFFSDASGMRVTQGLRMELKRKRCKNYKIPDLIILCPNDKYNGLIIELKRGSENPFKKDGSLKAGEHIEEQFKSILELSRLGYYACFAYEFHNCQDIIDKYFKNEL